MGRARGMGQKERGNNFNGGFRGAKGHYNANGGNYEEKGHYMRENRNYDNTYTNK